MAQSGVWLAIGSGKVVQLIKQGTIGSFIAGLTVGLSSDLGTEQPLGRRPPSYRTRLSSRS